jgi:glycerophosphoryl diester phosphodiesterase
MRQAVFALLSLIAGCAGPKETPVKWPTLDGKPPLIIAHRGASGYLPEHTLEAYALAIEQGADVVEPDLVFTKDGVLVARHDRYLSTTTNVADKPEFASRRRANNDPKTPAREDWWVEDFTLAEIKTLRARQPFPGRSKEHDDKFEIPTFAEMLTLVAAKSKEAGRPVGVYPETKHPSFFASIGHDFEAPLLRALEGFDAGPVFIQSFEPEILKRLKGKTDAKLVQLVFEETPGAGPNIPLEEIATYADGVGPAKSIIIDQPPEDFPFIKDAHQNGLTVHPWTFRNEKVSREDITRLRKLRICREYGSSKDECASTLVSKVLYLVAPSEGFGDVPVNALEEMHYFFVFGADGLFTDLPETAAKVRAKVALPVR